MGFGSLIYVNSDRHTEPEQKVRTAKIAQSKFHPFQFVMSTIPKLLINRMKQKPGLL